MSSSCVSQRLHYISHAGIPNAFRICDLLHVSPILGRFVTLCHVTVVALLAFDCSVIQYSRMNLRGCVSNKIFDMDDMSLLFFA